MAMILIWEWPLSPDTSASITQLIQNRALHLQVLKTRLEQAQNMMKVFADRNQTDQQFSVGDSVLLRLQPYTQSLVANRPFPKLSYKFFGPYKILERIGPVAYRLHLPTDSVIHPVFHISQLKAFHQDYTPVYSTLPAVTDLEATTAVPERILERRLVKKGTMLFLRYCSHGQGYQLRLPLGKTTMSFASASHWHLLGVKQSLRRGRCHNTRLKTESSTRLRGEDVILLFM
jgi:hypothetical protein